jgi:branched-chain amino acid transport system ATP-binding protein
MLRATGLSKSFGALQATRDVALHLRQGARHALIGPNGAGKTTLFNLLAGELRADSGQILLDGRDITRATPDARARAGLGRSFQRNNLFETETVRQNLLFADIAAQGHGWHFWRRLTSDRRINAAVEAMARQVGLDEVLERPVASLSYGARRQLEIGLALMGSPRVLLLDEPAAGMSADETERMLALIAGLPHDLAVLIVEHDMDLVFAHADRITVLNYGQVLFEGTPDEVRRSALVQETYLGADPGGGALQC